MSSSDTLVVVSEHRIDGNTLTLYTGDGDEIFESYNGRIFPDSVVRVAIERGQVRRYARRRRTGRVAK